MTERHFRVVQLANKKVEIGGVSITSKASPGSAARKLLTSIAHEKGLKKNKKVNMGKVTFSIQEYTQGSSKKVYGPYVGHFHKYTAAELKKAKTAGGKVKFTMKPVVKLAKKNMKGGNITCPSNNKGYMQYLAYDNQGIKNGYHSFFKLDEDGDLISTNSLNSNEYILCSSDNHSKFYLIPKDCNQIVKGIKTLKVLSIDEFKLGHLRYASN